jgi:hypothetical protein
VVTGQWWAAFTDTTVANASQLDIDHLVPLNNAHLSGGWAWDAAMKRRYANVLTDATHLIAVTASANRSKGARGPDQWKPPNTAYWCTYATDWVGVKNTWGLTVTAAEAAALTEMLSTCGTTVTVTQAATPALTTPSPTPEPTPAPTSTPPPQPTATPAPTTPDPTPTSTPEPTPDPNPAAAFEIVALDCEGRPESITIRNTGSQPASLGGWSIHDEGPQWTFTFAADMSLAAGGEVTVWSGKEAGGKTVVWRLAGVWNNKGDTAFLLNPSGAVVSQRACA